MCGLCGIVDYKNRIENRVLSEMIKTLAHRGPNNLDVKITESKICSVGVAHARLSIIDLSTAANQPMDYMQYTVIFNGEIYNFREIRDELSALGHHFHLDSDTEVVLHSFAVWGTQCVSRFIGMFAFVIYDNLGEKLYLFRDRAGVKPLYYYWSGDLFLFGSELKSICKHPEFPKKMDMTAVAYYFKMGYIPAPFSIYESTKKINPGYFGILDLKTKEFKTEKYWDVNHFYQQEKTNISYQDAKIQLQVLLESACNYRMVADVPVGVFLSGGYDSTAVAAILQSNRTEKIKTFTIGFEQGNNEAPFAKETASYLGTEHTEYICKTKETQDIIPNLPYYYDEPFSDSSAIPTILVSKIAKSDVTVALSADAGDEIFGGYNSYLSYSRNSKVLAAIEIFNCEFIKSIIDYSTFFLPNKSLFYAKIKSLSSILNLDENQRYSTLRENMLSIQPNIFNSLLKNMSYPHNLYTVNNSSFDNPVSIAMAMDYKNYLHNDILTKVDRATMSVSLEGREPLVDHRLLEYAAKLPVEYKFKGAATKIIFKEIVHKYVPQEMMNRPKTGFSLPINDWLKSDLSYLIDEYLNKSALGNTGIFNVEYIENLVIDFRKNKLKDETLIWIILQFQMWHKKWMC